MSTLVFVSQSKPEPKLEMVTKYKAYLSKEDKEKIIEQLKGNIKNLEDDDYRIDMHVEIEIKKYHK